MVIMRMAEAMRVVIHTPRWFMLGNKDIQTSNGKDGLSYSIIHFSAVHDFRAPQTETEPLLKRALWRSH
jgi:hypothetical protein